MLSQSPSLLCKPGLTLSIPRGCSGHRGWLLPGKHVKLPLIFVAVIFATHFSSHPLLCPLSHPPSLHLYSPPPSFLENILGSPSPQETWLFLIPLMQCPPSPRAQRGFDGMEEEETREEKGSCPIYSSDWRQPLRLWSDVQLWDTQCWLYLFFLFLLSYLVLSFMESNSDPP